MPPESDIVLDIKFDPASSPSRVFDIAADLIRSFEEFDKTVIQSIDSRIETAFLLEDVEKSSLKVFLRNLLRQADDDAVKTLDWKPAVGQYLLKAKYAALEWLDKEIERDGKPSLPDLTEKIRLLAAETEVRVMPDYAPIKQSRLAQSLDAIQRAKSKLHDDESLTITLDKQSYSVKIKENWMPSEYVTEAEEQQLRNESDLVLVIRKPDFLGSTKWQFRHGKANISATISDEQWLEEFRTGKHALRPGDALRVRMRFEYRYGKNGDLLDQSQEVIRVYGVIHQDDPPPRFL